MVKRTKKAKYSNVRDAEALLELLGSYTKDQGIIADVFTITPELAQELLDKHNSRNRPLTPSNWKKLAKHILDGTYQLNGEAMIIDWDHELTNGQHTLTAVVETGVAIEKVVVFGLDPETFTTLDGGKLRKLDDVLAVDGEAHARELAIAVRLAYILVNNLKVSNMGRLEFDEARSFLSSHPGLRDSVSFILEMETPASYVISPGYAAALHYLMTQAVEEDDVPKVEQFWKDVVEMDGVTKNNAAGRLNKRLLAHKTRVDDKHLRRDQIVECCIKAWNYYRDGKELRKELSVPKSEEGTWFIGGFHEDKQGEE